MDHHPTPFPGETNNIKQKTAKKSIQEPKTLTREPTTLRQKRVFGTARNTNIPANSVTDKSVIKPTKQRTRPENVTTTKPVNESSDKKSPENLKSRLNKKVDTFPRQHVEKPKKNSLEKDLAGPRTPVVVSPCVTKPKVTGGTPYLTAENCSKCRFDRLETSSYWVGQIKLAESVGKHFVSAAFFRLAFESKAEPIRSLRIGLKRYLTRHGHLAEKSEWKEVSITYGLLKGKSNIAGTDSSTEMSNTFSNVLGEHCDGQIETGAN
ncbi:mediator of DNA damage checkpoint protein 1-like [Quillaja saponaria]|uniref:Mediator of DNA damage checkpoint protein 1-like n=1 Tax=Quillaja saponaria TaxID=32244 RepID=A0AAD7PA74_QUISA|nr:mediator of DNA damage checkpoint protein 1-like [Quillaja saponaria]